MDANRNRIEQTDGEGNVVTFTYDALNRLDFMVQDSGGFNLTTNHDYDPNGNETKLTDPKGQVITFDYDELNRLKSKVYNLL
jgi:YD repeat-containing protein